MIVDFASRPKFISIISRFPVARRVSVRLYCLLLCMHFFHERVVRSLFIPHISSLIEV